MRRIAVTLIAIGVVGFGVLFYAQHAMRTDPAFAERLIWRTIKARFIRPSGLVESERGKTTSESQSYGMLAAVSMDDKKTFDRIWQWTKENLERDDQLFSWRWERDITDLHTAPDADQDIAYALILAATRWGNETYLEEARKILRSFWEKDTEIAGGTRYVTGGDWVLEDHSGTIVNPSYLSPFLYREFQKIDPERPWNALVDSSYRALLLCRSEEDLPADWCKFDPSGNRIRQFEFGGKDPNLYSYDAFRVPFRIALDYRNTKDERALSLLQSSTRILRSEWETSRTIHARYEPDGTIAGPEESSAAYGAFLAAVSLLETKKSDEIYREKIALPSLLTLSFYDLAWAWFSIHFITGGFSH